ncbi:MAG TPA: hypothetical protein VGQ42_08635 [Candidatus Dormibacteraeota bacterium]|nr:hypothetical protein [Candidatus Dormibacteraeota bacterium]
MTSRDGLPTNGAGTAAGVQANARLTGLTGLVVLLLIAIEVVTVVLKPPRVLAVHLAVGLVLVPLVVLKLGSVSWRFAKYYLRFGAYRQNGPPPLGLRLLGPALILFTVVILVSGVLLVVGPGSIHDGAFTVHKVVFYPWLLAIALHVVGHFRTAVDVASADLVRRAGDAVAGVRDRVAVVVTCAAVGVLLAVMLTGRGSGYLQTYYPGR